MVEEYEKDNPAFEVELPWPQVGAFITEQVSAGTSAGGLGGKLGRWVASDLDLSQGRCETWLTQPARAGEINLYSGAELEVHRGSDAWLGRRLRAYFAAATGPALWIEVDTLAREGDPWLDTREVRGESEVIFTEKDTYWVLTSDDAAGLDDDVMLRVLNLSPCASGGVWVLASCDVDTVRAALAPRSSEAERRALVESIDGAIIDAYDGDGFVIWWKNT